MEVMLCSLHMAETGFQNTRGGRWNMPGDMKKRPPHFDEVTATSPRSDQSTDGSIALPDMLPANYEVLRDENQITETAPPKSCPCFRDERDPDGRLRHLAGLILH